ncbi:hypothetical protein KC640_01080 [Candidatus Dojkabacteria bacterium]|uniref:ArsR family transcriptional regulator n=1 Tax=Candidatus Dojkabacteria bacterium TaxID=2099670 RepID=A0A955I5M8_9BACT|nr:hypothetical protein [Candidatus Dojkabacteria bacterium]
MVNPRKYLDQLFISKVRIKAIRDFFMNPDKPIHLRGAVRELDEEINAVRRELERMEQIKFVTSERKGNRKYFTLNPDFVFFAELQGIVFKSFGIGAEIITNQNKLGHIDFAVLTQRYVHGREFGAHDVDLVVIGDVDLKLLDQIVGHFEDKQGRDIHYTVLSRPDFEVRRRHRDNFVMELLLQQRLMLIGDGVELVGRGN